MSEFYQIINGEKKKYPFKSGEFKIYEEVCLTIWGCLPLEVSWAVETNIYKEQLDKMKNKGVWMVVGHIDSGMVSSLLSSLKDSGSDILIVDAFGSRLEQAERGIKIQDAKSKIEIHSLPDISPVAPHFQGRGVIPDKYSPKHNKNKKRKK